MEVHDRAKGIKTDRVIVNGVRALSWLLVDSAAVGTAAVIGGIKSGSEHLPEAIALTGVALVAFPVAKYAEYKLWEQERNRKLEERSRARAESSRVKG